MSGVFSPRSEMSLTEDLNESGAQSSRIPSSRRTPRAIPTPRRTPRTPRQGGTTMQKDAQKLKMLAKWQSRSLKDKNRSKTQVAMDEEQSSRVKQALDRRARAQQTFSSSMATATRAKMVRFPDLLPELEQMKFFHEVHDEHKEAQIEITAETEEIVEEEVILNVNYEVTSTPWGQRALLEEEAKIYCLPGQEAELDPTEDNLEIIRQANEFNGIFIGDEIQLSDNLRAWLKRDGWLVNGVPYCLEEAVYSYPVRHWTLPYGNERNRPIKTKSPRVYPSDIPDTNAMPEMRMNEYELVVNIKYYKFYKHHLMTEEVILEAALLKMYDTYVDANRKLSTSKYETTLKQYREAWKRKMGESNTFQGLPSSPSKISIAQLLDEVIAVRRRRNQELKNVKLYYNKVFELWQQLVMMRQNQGYNTSKCNMKIYSVEPGTNDRENWELDLSEEMDELRHRHTNLEDQYRKDLKLYKRQKKEIKEKGSNEDSLLPPIKPPEWDDDIVRQELIEGALRDRRNPTENIKTIILDVDGLPLSNLDQISISADRVKMENLQKYKYFVKLFYNGVFVTQSEQYVMAEQLTIQDGNFYKIRTREKPKSMRVEIHEVAGRFKQRTIGDAILDIPSGEISENSKIERQTLFPQRTSSSANSSSGTLVTSLFWGTDEESGKVLSPKNYKSEVIYDHRKPDVHDPELHLYSEGEDVIDDPNDPAYVAPSADGTPVSEAYNGFVLNPYMTDGFFCGAEEIEKSKRLRFLQMREQEVTEFVGRKMVPLKEHEIQDSEFKDYEERVNQNYENLPLGDRRAAIRLQRKRMKEMVMQRLRAVSKTLSFNEVIIEDPMPEFGTLLGNFTKFFEARRPLRPERKVVKRRPNEQVKEPKIIISIRSAQNLPIRSNKMDEETLKPFVTVSFMDSEERTSVAFGSNPSWNEQMELSWTHGISKLITGGLAKEEFIYINVFDEELLLSGGDTDGEYTKFAMKNWIGGVTVPLSSLITRGLVEGELHLNIPPLMFNYHKETDITPTMDVYISIDANGPQGHDDQQFPTNESTDMAQSADEVISNLSKRFPDREYFALVADLKGETRFVTRYVCPLNIPTELESESLTRDQMAHRLSRYVSLIPYETDSIYFSGSYDLWGNNKDFLQCLIGDDEEHANLLLSYFITIEMASPKLLFGYSINHGSVCWVTTKDERNETRLWNPLTGDSYYSTDPKCPLTAVYCAADELNIYYNVQSDVRPNRINWNFDSWQKLWSTPPESPLETIQIREFNYDPIDVNIALRDASNLERFIKERIRSWGLGQLTRFRSDIAQMMKRIVEQCEFMAMSYESDGPNLQPIREKFNKSKIVGFPLHLRLQSTDLNQIERIVKSVGIHKSNRSNVEFGIAVHIQPYPGNIQSLWIYLTQITPI